MIKKPEGWLDEGQIMGKVADEVDADLRANPAERYRYLKAIGVIDDSREDGFSVDQIERAYGITIPPEDRRTVG